MKVQLLRLWLLWGSSHTPYDLSRCVTEHGLGGPKRNSRTPPTCEVALPLGETTVQVKARVAVISEARAHTSPRRGARTHGRKDRYSTNVP